MGAGFFQDLNNQGATQNATQFTMPTYQNGGVATTQGQNFNQSTNVLPYWGTYTEPLNINPPKPVSSVTTDKNGRVVKTNTKDKSTSSFENPSPLPNYSMYIPPSQMPDINAYLANPNSLLGAMQDANFPMAGAGRFSNLLSTNSKGK